MGLESLYFGKAASENEVADDPDRFLRTYYDRWRLLDRFENHEKFLVLGPKGSGKSAASHYLQLGWSRQLGNETVFPTFVDFDDLNRTQTPLASLDKKLVGEVPALTDAAWRLFLTIRLLDSLIGDQACNLNRDPQILRLMGDLKSAGLASDDYPQVLRRVRERKGGIQVPQFLNGELKSTQTDEVSIGQLGDALLRLVLNCVTPNRHLLAIDGLDKAIGDRPAYWQTLAALIRVTDSIRRELRSSSSSHVYVVILCRSDVFRRVKFSESAKISADGGIYMDWAAEADDPRDVQLWDYIFHKAEVDRQKLFRYFPDIVSAGDRGKTAIDRYLLQVTRYTPRDMTLLMNCLQERDAGQRLTSSDVRRAADTFSSRHLLTEIIAEAAGLLPDNILDKFEQIISGLPARKFTRDDLTKSLIEAGIEDKSSVTDFGEYLFLQGAIGNFRENSGYVQFYHRRDAYKFEKDGPWLLHTGLVYAFNTPWSSSPRKRRPSRRGNQARLISGVKGSEQTIPLRRPKVTRRRKGDSGSGK